MSETNSRNRETIHEVETEAWDLLRKSIMSFNDQSVGTVAARDGSRPMPMPMLNYDQVFLPEILLSRHWPFYCMEKQPLLKTFWSAR